MASKKPPCPHPGSCSIREGTSESKVVLEGIARPLPSSVSAQDLRSLLEWDKVEECSPKGVIDACKGDFDKKSSLKVDSSRSPWHRFFKLWKSSSIKRLPSLSKISRRKSRSLKEYLDTDLQPSKASLKNFSLSDLRNATDNFSQENLIGTGGYAEVYKGRLQHGQLVAIKRLNKGMPEDRIISFLSEIGIIVHVNHPNTAKMIGYGVDGGTFIVLELSSQGCLGSLLRGPRDKMDWGIRYKIILGTADGLLYLHENCKRRIIHRDIKADNILLTEEFEPQVALST